MKYSRLTVVKDGVEFKLLHWDKGSPSGWKPTQKGVTTRYAVDTGLVGLPSEGMRSPEWKLPSNATFRRLAQKFLGCECRIDPKWYLHNNPTVREIEILVGIPLEDRMAFLAAVAAKTRVK